MEGKLISLYELQIRRELDKILPGIYDKIETIAKLHLSVGLRILGVLVGYACKAQHLDCIILGRKLIKKMPTDWVIQHLPEAVKVNLYLDDEWEYRRLLELISEVAPQLLKEYIAIGLESNNWEVREAAEDFLD